MAAILELVLIFAGALLAAFVILLILIPLLYGVPFVLYWTFRRCLKWRAPFLYPAGLIFWMLVVSNIATVLVGFFPNFVVYLTTNFWFISGLLIGIIVTLGRIAFFQAARSDIHNDLIACIKSYVTPKGRMVLLALYSRW